MFYRSKEGWTLGVSRSQSKENQIVVKMGRKKETDGVG